MKTLVDPQDEKNTNSVIIAEFMGIFPIKGVSEQTGKIYYYYNNFEMTFRSYDYRSYLLVVEKIMTLKFDDGDYYHLRTFGLRCEKTNGFMVRFDRHQVFTSESLLDALYLAVLDCIGTQLILQ
jgi:hypothetical protein